MLSPKIVKHLNQLQYKKYRREYSEFVIEGIKGVAEAFASKSDVLLLIVEGSQREEKEIIDLIVQAESRSIPVEFCGRKDIGNIKTTDTFPGVMAVVEYTDNTIDDITAGHVVCLHDIKDPGNLGTIIRTADWFGISTVLLSENSVDVYNPKVVRSTMGSIFHVQVIRSHSIFTDLSRLRDDRAYQLVALDIAGTSLPTSFSASASTVFVFGSESHGLPRDLDSLIHTRYTIPGKGQAESLNVAISAGILMSRLS